MLAYSRILCENREYGPEIRNFFGAKIEIIFETTKENVIKLRRRGRIDASRIRGISVLSLSGGSSRVGCAWWRGSWAGAHSHRYR